MAKVKENDAGRYDSIKLENQLCFPLYACAKEIVRQYRAPLDKIGLTYTQYIVMMILWEKGDMTEGEIGKCVCLDSGTLAPLLKRLEAGGLVDRKRRKDDERTLLISLTRKGRELREKALAVPEAMDGCIDLPEKDLKQLKALLEKALSRMKNSADKVGK